MDDEAGSRNQGEAYLYRKERLCYERDVCPSVRPSVTLVDCDHIVQQKVEMGTRQDRSWLSAC